MKITYKWLKEYVDFDFSPEELVERLTMLGLEVDSCSAESWEFDGIVVGEVLKKEDHQDSDHLWVCEVEVGQKRLSVVCGAPNVEVGQKVPVAAEGTRLPDGTIIQLANIRGVDSQGMICSEAELGLSSRRDGIMVLDEDTEQGRKLSEVLGESEIVIDIDVTPNRPDCFGVIGVAREVAALTRMPLQRPAIDITEASPQIEDLIKIQIQAADKCPRYTARFISNVEIKDSPWWLVQRLEAVGVRAINNIVDVTNYVMMETGQPLHAFDYDLLRGAQINVRTAADGTSFTTLDDKRHDLNAESLMICDGEGEVAIGGVMGGLNSEVSAETNNVLLESAYFDPVNIRRTAKRLGISTEASRRFERGVDPNGSTYALDRAAQLISELAGGKIVTGIIDVYPNRIEPRVVKLRIQRIELLLGISITIERVKEILSGLDFNVLKESTEELELEIPTFRPDIQREADLIEEVARHYGYDKIPADDVASIQQLAAGSESEAFSTKLHSIMTALGFSRAVTYCMLSQKDAGLFTTPQKLVQLINPIGEDFSTLRPSILPGLLNVVRWNINRKNTNLKLFEMGTVFGKSGKEVHESTRIAGVLTGTTLVDSWKGQSSKVDIYDVKGVIETLMSRSNVHNYDFAPHRMSFLDENALQLEMDGKKVGYAGGLNQQTLDKFEIEQPVWVLDIDFSLLFDNSSRQKIFQPIPKFPPISRDIAVTVSESIEAGHLLDQIRKAGGDLLQSVSVFDVFTGEQVGSGSKSIAFRLKFFSLERTLTEEEVDTEINSILKVLAEKFSARLRD
ncbi:phenylalanine--tRNA ligase subunit beta [bacterium]|nr:phenylalanine--tRNA ligase subunit beta [bacterium]